MRIRKHARRVSVGFPVGESQVFGVWKLGWDMDCEKLLHRAAAVAAVQEESSWVDFLTMSKHPGINAIVNDKGDGDEDRGRIRQTDRAFFSNEWAKPESVSEKPNGVGDLNILKVKEVHVMQSQEGGQHVTRHYVRRRKDGNGGAGAAAPVRTDCANADMNAARQTVGKSNRDMYALKQTCVELGEEIQPQGSLRTDLPMAGDATCIISKAGSFHDKKIIRDYPFREGSLLHALYLQLLAAGKEGLTVRQLFASFKRQLPLSSLAMDWKDRVRAHLKTNPCFGEVKGRYLLHCEQINATVSGFRAECCKSSVSRSDVQPFESTGMPTALHFSGDSNDIHEAIQTSRKSNENIIEAALTESAVGSQNIQEDARTEVVSTVPDFRAFNLVTTPHTDRRGIIHSTRAPSLEQSRRKIKSSLHNDEEFFQGIKNDRAITEDHIWCEHHIFLKEWKIAQHAEDAKINKNEKMSKRPQEAPDLIALGHVPKSPESEQEDVVADHVVEALVTLKSHVPTDAACQSLTHAIAGHRQAGEGIAKDDEPKRTSEKLLQHLFTSAPKRRHVAAKKTAVTHGPLLENEQPAQSPGIPPLPMQHGYRRKTVKNKSLLSFRCG